MKEPSTMAHFRRPITIQLVAAWVLATALAQGAEPRAGRAPPDRVPISAVLTPPPPAPATSLAMLLQVVTALEHHVRARHLDYVHNEDEILAVALSELLSHAETVAPGQSAALKATLTTLAGRVTALHIAADLGQQAQAEIEFARVIEAFGAVQRLFPAAVVAEAQKSVETFTCPMHADIVGRKAEPCPKCGMALDQIFRILPNTSDLSLASRQSVRASVRLPSPPAVGEPARAILRLEKTDGSPVLPADLIETHTRRIHLLIVDPSLSDYHHEHPEPTRNPGEYTFSFTPRKPGGYRAWADLRVHPLGFQQYAMADIAGTAPGEPITDRNPSFQATVDGLNYELVLPDREMKVGRPMTGRLRVTTPDGKGFARLEPVMATFAHFVGFNEDYKSILHLHPKGPAVLDLTTRGGPELEFVLYASKPGFYQLFAQVQIEGRSRFAPFGIRVLP